MVRRVSLLWMDGCVMSSLFFLKFLPSGLTLFNGEANSASNVVPVGTEAAVGFELDELEISFTIPIVPVGIGIQWRWRLTLFLGWLWC